MKRSFASVLATVLLMIPTIASGTPAGRDAFDGTSWVLASLTGTSLQPDLRVTLGFEDGQLHGTDGCNRYSASYTADARGFRLAGPLVSTKMACPGPVMQQAQAFLAALDQAREARIEGKRVILSDETGRVLATLEAQSRDPAGSAWEVAGYNNGRQAVVSVRGGSTLTIAFSEDGKVSGSAGCNRYTGGHSVSGKTISIGRLAATRKLCADPEGVMEQEAQFLKALERATAVRIDGDRLELRAADGALLVSARRTLDRNAGAAPNASAAPAAHGLRLPATFRGDLPCADCEAVRHHLDLWPDQVFALRREWLGKQTFRDAIGRWGVDPARKALILRGGAEMPLQFEIKGMDRLQSLDMAGKPIVSRLPYELTSDGRFAPTDLSLTLGGEMQYMADAAVLTECLTGRRYPMAMEADYLKAERAYLGAVKEPGAPLYVSLEGEVVQRPRMEGEGTEPTVVVRRFINVWPQQKCERARADASLTNTYWRIVRLGDEPVQAAPDRREPHLILKAGQESGRFSATVGCNQLLGGYEVEGEAIRMKPAAATLMACPEPLAETERKLSQALESARRWRINAATLEFYNDAGSPVALFEAVHL